jgi:hypothetical protein
MRQHSYGRLPVAMNQQGGRGLEQWNWSGRGQHHSGDGQVERPSSRGAGRVTVCVHRTGVVSPFMQGEGPWWCGCVGLGHWWPGRLASGHYGP